jgi:thiol:disulfide interchange protein
MRQLAMFSEITGFARHSARGLSVSEWLIYGLIGVVLLVSMYAISGSLATQRRVAGTFSDWYENQPGLERALADQKATGRPMLVYIFADWCPHCKQFAAQILSDPKTRQFVKNYPHVRIEPDHGPAERDIMDDYGAQGYPSFYVVLPAGERVKIDTHTEANGRSRMKTPDEFIDSVLEATGEQSAGEKAGSPQGENGPTNSSAAGKDGEHE